MTIRPIDISEVEAFRALRLQALAESPDAFGSAYEEASQRTLEEVRANFSNTEENFVMGAFTPEGRLVAMAGFKREERLKSRHRAGIWGVYVAPEARRQGLAAALLRAIIAHGRQLDDLHHLILTVTTTCEPACQLYRTLGFEENGLDRGCLRYEGIYYDNLNMIYRLDP